MLYAQQVVSKTFTNRSLETSFTLFEQVKSLAQDFATRADRVEPELGTPASYQQQLQRRQRQTEEIGNR